MQEPHGEEAESLDRIEEPDYSTYTIKELRDVRSHLDAERYPRRAERLQAEIARRMASPGKYEPAGRAPSDWWPRHWPKVLGILGIVLGLLGLLSHAGGMVAVFKARPAVEAPPGGEGAGMKAAGSAKEEAAEGSGGNGGTGGPGEGGMDRGGEPAEGDAASARGADPGGEETGQESGEDPPDRQEPPAEPESGTGGESPDPAAEGDAAAGEAGEEESPGGRDAPDGGGPTGTMVWIMPSAASAIPREAPRWFLAWSAGTRFAGVVISVVVLYGAVLLVKRREDGIFWLITGLLMALALNFTEQGLRAVSGLAGTLPVVLGLLLGILWNGLLIALLQTGHRKALR